MLKEMRGCLCLVNRKELEAAYSIFLDNSNIGGWVFGEVVKYIELHRVLMMKTTPNSENCLTKQEMGDNIKI